MAGKDGIDDGEGRRLDEDASGEPSPRDKTEGEREQIKLQAAYMNGIAIGVFIVGGFTIPTSIILKFGRLGFCRNFRAALLRP